MAKNVNLFAKNPGHDFIRNRKLGFTTLMSFLIGIKGGTLDDEIEDYFSEEEVMSSSAFVQQRNKLNDYAFPHLLQEFNKRTSSYDNKKYNGRRILAIDGSDFNIAYNENDDTFVKNQKGIGYNQFHLNAIYDVLNNTFANINVQPRSKINERKACLEMIEEMTFTEPTLLIGDRGYEGYNLFALIEQKENLDYLIRVKDKGTKLTKSLPMTEFDMDFTVEIRTTQTNEDKEAYKKGTAIYLPGPSKLGKNVKNIKWTLGSPYELPIRVVRFKIAKDKYETIITSLSYKEFPLEEIKKMYHKRWAIETGFRWLKYAVGTVNFHGKSKFFALQEIYAHIIMFNFGMRIMMNVHIKQDANCKYIYKVNHTKAFKYCRKFWCYRGSSPPNVLRQIRKKKLPIREGRRDMRKQIQAKKFVPYLYRVAA
jgi:hypothetical protein